MRLVIGGMGQGKLAYVLRQYGLTESAIAVDFETAKERAVFCRFHQAVRNTLEHNGDPKEALEALLRVNPEIIIICDEVGCGVVPIEREERRWREVTGRLCCQLAERAESVERIFCGLSMRLK